MEVCYTASSSVPQASAEQSGFRRLIIYRIKGRAGARPPGLPARPSPGASLAAASLHSLTPLRASAYDRAAQAVDPSRVGAPTIRGAAPDTPGLPQNLTQVARPRNVRHARPYVPSTAKLDDPLNDHLNVPSRAGRVGSPSRVEPPVSTSGCQTGRRVASLPGKTAGADCQQHGFIASRHAVPTFSLSLTSPCHGLADRLVPTEELNSVPPKERYGYRCESASQKSQVSAGGKPRSRSAARSPGVVYSCHQAQHDAQEPSS